MSTLILGQAPGDLEVIITPEMPWSATITAVQNHVPWAWPTGTTVVLESKILDAVTEYPGDINDSDVTFSMTADQVNAIPDLTVARVIVTYPGSTPFRWTSGKFLRRS